jgi:CheY-like chemotaxis protein
MEGARVLVIDDESRIRGIVRRNLEVCGHSVAGEAGSVDTAEALVNRIAEGDGSDQVDAAVVDGNLRRNVYDGTDGARVAKHIRDTLGSVIIVGMSLGGPVAGADVNIPKHDMWGLVEFIEGLPARQD